MLGCSASPRRREIRRRKLDAYLRRLRANDPCLSTVDLSYQRIGPEGVAQLVDAILISHAPVRELWLRETSAGDAGAESVASLLRSAATMLELLDFGDNQITDDGAAAIASGLRSDAALLRLDLSGNRIGPEGGGAVGAALHNNATLRDLSLGCNQIGDWGAVAIGNSLRRNAAIEEIDLYNNKIRDLGAKAIAACLSLNTTLRKLHLHRNRIEAEGMLNLEASLHQNYHITKLDLRDNFALSCKIPDRIRQLVHMNAAGPLAAEARKVGICPSSIRTADISSNVYPVAVARVCDLGGELQLSVLFSFIRENPSHLSHTHVPFRKRPHNAI